MGQSTDAILFYGYCWEEELENPWDDPDKEIDEEDYEDWGDRYARLHGQEPWEAVHGEAKRRKWWAKRDKLIVACPCVVSAHCHHEYPMPFVAIKETVITASRGSPEQLPPTQLNLKPQWRRQLDEFCKLMEIKPPQEEPRWWLVSYWG